MSKKLKLIVNTRRVRKLTKVLTTLEEYKALCSTTDYTYCEAQDAYRQLRALLKQEQRGWLDG